MSLASFQSESPRYVGEPDQSGTPLDSRLASLFIGPIVLFPFEERSLKGTRRVQCRQRPLSPPIKRAFIHSVRQDRHRQTMQSRSPTLCIRRAVATTSRQPVSRQAGRRRYHVPSLGLQEPARTGRGWRAATIVSRASSTSLTVRQLIFIFSHFCLCLGSQLGMRYDRLPLPGPGSGPPRHRDSI